VEAARCEREPALERRVLQERPERPMKLPVRQSEHLRPPVEAARCEREPAPERRELQERPERPMKLPMRQSRHLGRRWRR